MTQHCDGTCQGAPCIDCGEHVHPWDDNHGYFCEPAQRRRNAALLAIFINEAELAAAVISPTGMVHDVNCQVVKAHMTYANTAWEWRAWRTTQASAVVGKSCQVCSPSITVQRSPRRLIRRLTGLGWPNEGGGCARGHLPRWTREVS